MFCEAMATTNSGMPMLIAAFSEKLGVVHTGTAISRRTWLKSSRPCAAATPVPTSSAVSTA